MPLICAPDSSEFAPCSCDSNVVSLAQIRGPELGAEKIFFFHFLFARYALSPLVQYAIRVPVVLNTSNRYTCIQYGTLEHTLRHTFR